MAAEDSAEYKSTLNGVLKENGFGWIVDQAELHIAEGKASSKQVSEREVFSVASDPDFVVRPPRRRRVSLVTSEAYSEIEQLEILLRAIEAAIGQRADLETAVLSIEGVTSITFQPDRSSAEVGSDQLGRAHGLTHDRLRPATTIAAATREALNRIRRRDSAYT